MTPNFTWNEPPCFPILQCWSRLLATIGGFLLLVILIVSPSPVTASGVEARYLSSSGETVHLRITISEPAPQSLILEQYLPPGAKLVAASPPARQLRNSGVVKWLFKRVSPGSLDITMRVEPASAARTISGTIRYRLPGAGMEEQRISR